MDRVHGSAASEAPPRTPDAVEPAVFINCPYDAAFRPLFDAIFFTSLAPEGARYEQYASDLAGYDLERHDESVATVVTKVAGWLLTRPGAVSTVLTPEDIDGALPAFIQARDRLILKWLGGIPPWSELVRIARQNVPGG